MSINLEGEPGWIVELYTPEEISNHTYGRCRHGIWFKSEVQCAVCREEYEKAIQADNRPLKQQPVPEQVPTYQEMRDLLHRIYIARNISLREETIHECLRQVDKWFRDTNCN